MASGDSKFEDLSEADIDSLIDDAVPKNTKKATAWGISVLKDWLSKKYPSEVLESLSPEVLSERLKKFYQELRKSPTEHYSASAHLSIRAAIDRHLNTLPEFSGISIVRDPLFKIANKSLSAKLKQRKAQGFAKVQHHPSISPEDIQKCYETKVFSDETPISLLRVNWFNISLHFCRRGRENLRSLTPDSFVIKKDANGGEYVEMSISEKTKNHQGGLGDKADESDPKMFSTGMSNCPVKYFKKFLSVLNPNQTALFQKPKRNFLPSDEIWFENSPIGVNKLGDMMKEISLAASLSKVYTNHCVRSTTISALDEAGIPIHRIMQTSGHRSESSVKSYCDRQSLEKYKESSNILARVGHDSKESTSGAVVGAVNNIENLTQNSQSHNVQNVVANLNHSPTLNVLSRAEFKDCQININITKK
ncbi:unnamed protein product [Porites lobata]|uniref:ZMYM2-like/QRICH1 C-terminal domain-containing protein n=1 Tax=Porites lobata TaxID=104759 RepID=A0ABN8QCG4_9CNID|nr:unnamed protein product [Porites lobata]